MNQRVRVVAAVIEREGRLLVCRRPTHKRHGGLWEFPGGKVEPDEDDMAALRRELREELAVEVVAVEDELFRSDDAGSHFTIAFIPTVIDGEPEPLEHEEIMWASPEELTRLDLAPSDLLFLRTTRGSRIL